MRVPWGSLILVLIVADAVSLWLFHGALRDRGQGPVEAVLAVLAYLFFAVVAGVWAIRVGGGAALRRSLRASGGGGGWLGRVLARDTPDAGLLNALLALVGGALIAFPGLSSDVLGIALLVPPTRTLVRLALRRRMFAEARPPRTGGRPEARGREGGGPVDVEEYRVE